MGCQVLTHHGVGLNPYQRQRPFLLSKHSWDPTECVLLAKVRAAPQICSHPSSLTQHIRGGGWGWGGTRQDPTRSTNPPWKKITRPSHAGEVEPPADWTVRVGAFSSVTNNYLCSGGDSSSVLFLASPSLVSVSHGT